MRTRLAALAVGVVFGLVLCWSRMADPDVIRSALLLEQSYLYLFFASAVLVAALGGELVRRQRRRALLAEAPVGWSRQRPQRRHLVGGLVFGIGWAVADACPGPIATQLGQAIPWALATMAGVVLGIVLFQRGETGETEPALDLVASVERSASEIHPSLVGSSSDAPA
ncbi:MAG TPA: DUF6691 family protein [Solirubrobacterales bacterium]|nr:DUF6691 family protein [Solirubrobacterales bacterium]